MILAIKTPLHSALILVSLFLGACGGGSSSSNFDGPTSTGDPQQSPPASTPDSTAPSIVTRSPENDATGVSVTSAVVVTFSEPLDESAIDQQSLMVTDQGVSVPGNVIYDAAGNHLSFAPDSPLSTETVYGVTVANSLRDAAGNSFLGQNWFFTTGGPYNLGGTSQITIDQCMDDGDKQMLTLVNNARAVSRSCGLQQMAPVSALAWNCLLDAAALGHSTSMADNDFHEHVSPVDGSDPGDRIAATGYTPQAWGENIAAGQISEEIVMDAWLQSAGHCSNIMSSSYTEMGAGFSENPASTFRIYWTQNFARPQN